MLWAEIWKISELLIWKFSVFWRSNFLYTYLNRRVFVMGRLWLLLDIFNTFFSSFFSTKMLSLRKIALLTLCAAVVSATLVEELKTKRNLKGTNKRDACDGACPAACAAGGATCGIVLGPFLGPIAAVVCAPGGELSVFILNIWTCYHTGSI